MSINTINQEISVNHETSVNNDNGSEFSDSDADSLNSLAAVYENQRTTETMSDDGNLVENEHVIESVDGYDMLNRDRGSFSDDDL